VEDARSPESPLHSEFTWNVKEGFEENLIKDARHLLNHFFVYIKEKNKPREKRKYLISIQVGEKITNRIYVTLDQIARDPVMHQRAIEDFWLDAKRFYERYKRYEKFAEIKAFMKILKEQLRKRKMD